MNRRVGRRRLLGGAAAATGAAAVVVGSRLWPGWIGDTADNVEEPELGATPSGLPDQQHVWEPVLARDEHGNAVAPQFHRLLLFDLTDDPSSASIRRLEAAFRTLERRFSWEPDGLLFTVGWSAAYFERAGVDSPVPLPERLSTFETPSLDQYEVCLHLASDREERLAEIDAALAGDAILPGADGPLDLSEVLVRRETRTGFVGAGLPAARQRVGGIPDGDPVPPDSPLFMGFRSGFRRNQATEQDVTMMDGPLAGGSTMHVSRMRLRLESWYGLLDEAGRVARMFSPRHTPQQVAALTDEAEPFSDSIEEDATAHGVVGHLQAVGAARRDGRPVILRRDFDTIDGGEAGLHFVSLQRSIADFVETRRAMNAERMPLIHPAIGPRTNNGIKEFIFVLSRANYVLPPRRQRSFPLWPGRDQALA